MAEIFWERQSLMRLNVYPVMNEWIVLAVLIVPPMVLMVPVLSPPFGAALPVRVPILLLLHTKRFSDEQKSIAVNLKAKAAINEGEQEKEPRLRRRRR